METIKEIQEMQNKWNVKPRNMHAEWVLLNKYFGTETMQIWYNNYQGYADAREKATYQQCYEILKQ